jgi:proprotein convertase subtilisin/kexin type 5
VLCSIASNCSSCKSGFFLRQDSLCYAGCSPRFYPDSATLTCQACPYDCLACNGTGHCLSCDPTNDHRSLNSSTGRCVASTGFFDNGTTVALSCPSSCASCQNLTFCQNCLSGSYLRADHLCHADCSPRFVGNSSSLTCDLCPFDCYTCDQTGVCLSCNATTDFRQLSVISGRCNPIAGYYESSMRVSARCPAMCSACSSSTNCGSCSMGYYLRSSNMCYAFCLSRTFGDIQNRICQNCPSGCQECLSLQVCTVCDSGLFLRADQLCHSDCPPRFYGNPATTLCDPCPFDCYTCNQAGSCLSCNATADFRQLNTTTGRCVPLSGYYENYSTVCPSCPAHC